MLKRAILIPAVVVSLTLVTALAAMASGKPAPDPAPATVTTLSPNVRAQLAADAIVNADNLAAAAAAGLNVTATNAKPLAKEYDSSLVGMSITASGGLQVVVAGHASPYLTKAIADQADGVPVTVKVVPHSMKQLENIQARITADMKYWSAQGIDLTAWGPDLSSDKVSVMLARYSAQAASAITARYGAAWVTVATTSGTVQPSYSRMDDTALVGRQGHGKVLN